MSDPGAVPFPVDASIRLRREADDVQIGLSCDPFVEPDVRGHISSALHAFRVLGEAGAFSPSGRSTPGPRLALQRSDNGASWTGIGHGLEVGAFRVPMNVLVTQEAGRGQGLHVRLHSTTGGDEIAGMAALQAQPYPGVPSVAALPEFAVALPLVGLHPVLRFDFDDVLDETATNRLMEVLRSWEWLVAHQGFGPAVPGDQDVKPVDAMEMYLVGPGTLECSVTGWTAGSHAFGPVANLVMQWRTERPALRFVELQPY